MNDEDLRDDPADEDEAEATDERGDETKAGTVTVTGAAMTAVDSAALTVFLKSVETFCATDRRLRSRTRQACEERVEATDPTEGGFARPAREQDSQSEQRGTRAGQSRQRASPSTTPSPRGETDERRIADDCI